MRALRAIGAWLDAPRFGWQRRLAAYLIMFSGFTLCLTLIHHNGTEDRERDRRRFIQQSHLHCLERAEQRQVLRSVLALLDNGVDYSLLPSFADLDSATKRFLTEVAAATANARFRDQALRALPVVECPPPRY